MDFGRARKENPARLVTHWGRCVALRESGQVEAGNDVMPGHFPQPLTKHDTQQMVLQTEHQHAAALSAGTIEH